MVLANVSRVAFSTVNIVDKKDLRSLSLLKANQIEIALMKMSLVKGLWP